MSGLIERLRVKKSFIAGSPTYIKLLHSERDEAADALEAKGRLIAELVEALIGIRELNMENEDENGHRWANSDMINQSVVFALSKAKEQE